MIVWPLWLALVVGLPALARLAVRGDPLRSSRARRALSQLLHLAALACAALLAARSGAPHAAHPGWEVSTVLAVLFGSVVWVEGVMLVGVQPRGLPPAGRKELGPGYDLDGGAAGDEMPGAADGAAARAAEEPGELPYAAQALRARIMLLDRVTVEEIMTPRDRIVFVDAKETLGGALTIIRGSGHSRILVAAGSPDRILGVVHAKDLVPLVLKGDRPTALRRHLRRCLSVPAGHPVARVLEDFRRHRVHIGVVTDRLGNTVGLVTVTDVFRFIGGAPGGSAAAVETLG